MATRTPYKCNSERSLPGSLSEALDALEHDHDFLLRGDVFDSGQIAEWIRVKREEYYCVRNRPHPFEVAVYFDV
jgi:glutamine synthetase